MPFEIQWSLEAIYDVADIADYIEEHFGKERADRFDVELLTEVEKLGTLLSAFYT